MAAVALVLFLAAPIVGYAVHVATGRSDGLRLIAVVGATIVTMALLLGVGVIAGLAGASTVRVEVRGSGRRRSRRHRHRSGW
ncbi:hypothetical protein HC251_23590 [Iamia sp. SCSIO 61187]|uniref:hypothetical protein n=1 Tax=Iamia sp. SCSIO 61187 TaxID=2722752 RepID=UPI001C6347B8|nr:hypothetical protein [Iamia sp. SCSIO 61187]QYG95115.1 hypothetical protein HC251_23590 [Iamia sp. SCSIO 61187]